MEPALKNQPTSTQKRLPELNVIYFVDANRTKSFRMSLPKARIAMMAVIFSAIWFVASLVWIVNQQIEIAELNDGMQETFEVLFDYQVRTERVYEKAYPDKQAMTASSKSRAAPKAKKAPSKKKVIVAQKKVQKAVVAKPAPVPMVLSKKVKVDTVTFRPRTKGLGLKFTLRNVAPRGTRAEGFLFASAKFVGDDGSSTWVTMPTGKTLDGEIRPPRPSRGYRFAIKFYKSHKMLIPYPAGQKGAFTDLYVGVTLNDGTELQFQNNLPASVQDRIRKLSIGKAPKGDPLEEKPKSVETGSEQGSEKTKTEAVTPGATTSGGVKTESDKKVSYATSSTETSVE
jgi:hypothetical protein